jgi:hypothetical protein
MSPVATPGPSSEVSALEKFARILEENITVLVALAIIASVTFLGLVYLAFRGANNFIPSIIRTFFREWRVARPRTSGKERRESSVVSSETLQPV